MIHCTQNYPHCRKQLAEIRELIKQIGKEKTVMLSTHIMQEVEAICDRVVIINKGQIVADNTASFLQINEDLQVVYAEFEGEVSKNLLSIFQYSRESLILSI